MSCGIRKVQLIVLAQESRKWETITPIWQLVRDVDAIQNKRDRIYEQHICRIAEGMLQFCYLVQVYESVVVFDRCTDQTTLLLHVMLI
jgi:hypothetical protein